LVVAVEQDGMLGLDPVLKKVGQAAEHLLLLEVLVLLTKVTIVDLKNHHLSVVLEVVALAALALTEQVLALVVSPESEV
jgi:hypothetical protein